MYTANKNGDRTKPCSTLEVIWNTCDQLLPIQHRRMNQTASSLTQQKTIPSVKYYNC